jgi:hypothetical protein
MDYFSRSYALLRFSLNTPIIDLNGSVEYSVDELCRVSLSVETRQISQELPQLDNNILIIYESIPYWFRYRHVNTCLPQ